MKAIDSWLMKSIIHPITRKLSSHNDALLDEVKKQQTRIDCMNSDLLILIDQVREMIDMHSDRFNEQLIRESGYLGVEEESEICEALDLDSRMEKLEGRISENYLDMILDDYDFSDDIESAVDERLDRATVTISF